MESDSTSGAGAFEGTALIRELEVIANRLRTEFKAMPQTYEKPPVNTRAFGVSSLAWPGNLVSKKELEIARKGKFEEEYAVRTLVRMTNTAIVVFGKYVTQWHVFGQYVTQQQVEEKTWPLTSLYTSNVFRRLVAEALKAVPDLPIPNISTDFFFNTEDIHQYYDYLKESKHEDYTRWDTIPAENYDHETVDRAVGGEDIDPPPHWDDVLKEEILARKEQVMVDEPRGFKKAVGKISGKLKEKA